MRVITDRIVNLEPCTVNLANIDNDGNQGTRNREQWSGECTLCVCESSVMIGPLGSLGVVWWSGDVSRVAQRAMCRVFFFLELQNTLHLHNVGVNSTHAHREA